MNFYKLIIKSTLFVLLLVLSSANYLGKAQASMLKFDQLSIEDGLSQSTVFSILEDSRGFMWFGTRAGGLNKYDGYSFTVYKHKEYDSLSISDNEITDLYEDLDGNIWIGTHNNGLNKFDYKSGIFYKYLRDKSDSTALPSDIVHCLFSDAYNRLWVGTDNGLRLFNEEENNFIIPDNSEIKDVAVKSMAKSGIDSLIWLGTKKGLYLFNINSSEILKHFKHKEGSISSLTKDYVSDVIVDRNGRIWIGLYSGGLNCLDNIESDSIKSYQYKKSDRTTIASSTIRALCEDKKGAIWIATKAGLDQLNPKEQDKLAPVFIHHKKNDEDDRSISANSVYSIYEDSRGDFWVGTYTGGVDYVYKGEVKFKNYNTYGYNVKSVNSNVINTFYVDGNETWIGTKGGGLNLYNQKTDEYTYFKYDKKDNNCPLSDNIKSLLIDSQGNFWVGSSRGLSLLNREQKRFTPIVKDIDVISIQEGLKDELWLGTNKGLILYNKLDFTLTTYKNVSNNPKSLSNNTVNKLLKDSKGRIWIGTDDGLNLYDRDNDNFIRYIHDYNDDKSISHSHLTSIFEDVYGNIWFGTYDGLNRYNEEKNNFIHYDYEEGLTGNVITNILSDFKGNLWLTIKDQLVKFTPDIVKNKAQNQESGKEELRYYSFYDGLQKGEFRLNASYRSANGEMYLGGANGYNVFHPDSVNDNTNIPRVFITEFKLFNKTIINDALHPDLASQFRQARSITLTYKQSVFTIGFVALSYNTPVKNQFAHKMEGFDKEWNYIGNKREATYTNLPAGNYIFRVKASNSDGVWNNEGVLLKITILPPWWKTWWFITIVILIALGLVVSYYFNKINNLNRQRIILENKVLERTSELQEVNAELEEKHEEIIVQKESILQQNKELESQKYKIEKAYNNIETLSKIGKEITMSLSVEGIVETAYQSLQLIMELPVFYIALYDRESESLVFKGSKRLGETLPEFSYRLDEMTRMSVWCFNNQREVLVKDFEKEYKNFISEFSAPIGGIIPGSLICIPINIKGKRMGVISVQSEKKYLYTTYHQNIIQNIGIYSAIALDNAEAYDKIEKQALDLIEQKAVLEESNLAKDKFYSIIAHDLKNPLGAMVGFLEILQMNFTDYDDKKRASLLDHAFNSAVMINDLIHNLLQWSRAQKGTMPFNPEKVDLRSLVVMEVSLLESMIENKDIDLLLNFNCEEIVVSVDKNMLSTVIRNIVSNAIKFSFNGGTIEISVNETDEDILFKVADNGMGVPESVVDKLFRIDLDYRREGTANEKGTGMGLALCKEFIDSHKGKIWAESVEEKGCTIYFTIPKS